MLRIIVFTITLVILSGCVGNRRPVAPLAIHQGAAIGVVSVNLDRIGLFEKKMIGNPKVNTYSDIRDLQFDALLEEKIIQLLGRDYLLQKVPVYADGVEFSKKYEDYLHYSPRMSRFGFKLLLKLHEHQPIFKPAPGLAVASQANLKALIEDNKLDYLIVASNSSIAQGSYRYASLSLRRVLYPSSPLIIFRPLIELYRLNENDEIESLTAVGPLFREELEDQTFWADTSTTTLSSNEKQKLTELVDGFLDQAVTQFESKLTVGP